MKNLKTMFSSVDMTWGTPQEFYDVLNTEFNFTLDPCATIETAKCSKFYTKENNGLIQNWAKERVFCNPPYGSEIKKWVKKCYEENLENNILIVLLIPVRTDTQYFHNYIYQKSNIEIRFIKGRLKFVGASKGSGSAPFPSMLVIFKSIIREGK